MTQGDAAATGGLRRSATAGALSTGGSQALRVLIQLLSVVVLSRLLPPSEFGLMAMIAPIIAFVLMFGDLGLTQATVVARTVSQEQLSTLFWINAAFALLLTMGIMLLSPLIAAFYGEPRLVWPVTVLSISILAMAVSAQHQALLTRAMRFPMLAAIEVSASAMGFAMGVLIAWRTPTIWALVAATMVSTLVASGGMWLASGWRPGLRVSMGEARHLLRFGQGILGFNLTNFLSRNLDAVLIGRTAGPQELGYYDRAYKLLLFPLAQINGPAGRVLIPILSRLVDEPDRYRAAYVRTVGQLLLFTLPGVAFLVANAETLVPAVLGPQWEPSVPIFMWLGFAALHQPISATTGWLFISQSRTSEFALWGVVVAVTSIAAFVVGLPWGAVGVAAAYGISDLFVRAPIVWLWVGRKGPVSTRDMVRMALPHVAALAGALGTQLATRSVPLSGSVYLDLILRAGACYAVAWGILALFATGRGNLTDLARAGIVMMRKRGTGPTDASDGRP